jgi:hypothetical protein
MTQYHNDDTLILSIKGDLESMKNVADKMLRRELGSHGMHGYVVIVPDDDEPVREIRALGITTFLKKV